MVKKMNLGFAYYNYLIKIIKQGLIIYILPLGSYSF